MILRTSSYFDTGCAAYLFGCASLGQCAVVDPRADDVQAYREFAEVKAMRITHVIDTHREEGRAAL
jgi:hydroxyacylglutathione hydrolase